MPFHSTQEGPPCRNMESLLQEVASGTAKGWRRWYALAHAARCAHCGTFLQRLRLTLSAIKQTKEMPGDEAVLERLKAKLKEIEGA